MRTVWLRIATSALLGSSGVFAVEPPRVVASVPEFWAIGINSATVKAVSLTFDQRMRAGFSSWIGASSIVPEDNLEPFLREDGKTFQASVKLQPAKVYVFALNERGIRGVGFQNEKGISLPPTFLVFQTAGNPAPEEAAPILTSSIPPNGANGLDPAKLKSISITFDRAMNIKKHGLHLFTGANAVDLSRVRAQYSADGKTFTLYYDFSPSQAYRIELNNLHDIGFSSANRIPLWPVQIAFTTGQPR